MDLSKKRKVGILLSTAPDTKAFREGVKAASDSIGRGARTFVYCVDNAVAGVDDSDLQSLRQREAVLYACAFAAQRRKIPIDERATFAGLGVLGDLIAATDEFFSFTGVSE